MGKGLINFAAGFGGGYLGAVRQADLDEERKADRAMRKEEFDARMGEVNSAKDLRLSLRDAARPVEAIAGSGGALRPETMDNRDVGLPENASQPNGGLSLSAYRAGGKSYDTQPAAEAAAAQANTPDAVAQRQGQALRLAGKPVEALDIEQKQATITNQQREYAKKLKDEKVFDAASAFDRGDGRAAAQLFNSGGQFKVDGDPVMTQENRIIAGQTIPTWNAKIRLVGPDGQAQEKTYNSFDVRKSLMPFKDMWDMTNKTGEVESKASKRDSDVDNALARIKLTGELGEARLAAQQARGAAGGAREGDSRFTMAVNRAQSNLRDVETAAGNKFRKLTTVEEMNPAKVQAYTDQRNAFIEQNPDVVAAKKRYQQMTEREASSLGFDDKPKPSLADARPAGAAKPSAAPAAVKTKAERDALPKGTRYTDPSGNTFIKQ